MLDEAACKEMKRLVPLPISFFFFALAVRRAPHSELHARRRSLVVHFTCIRAPATGHFYLTTLATLRGANASIAIKLLLSFAAGYAVKVIINHLLRRMFAIASNRSAFGNQMQSARSEIQSPLCEMEDSAQCNDASGRTETCARTK